jgi:predicted transcriptional regulator
MNEQPCRPRLKPGPKPRGPRARVHVQMPEFLVDALDKAAQAAQSSRTRLLEEQLAAIFGLEAELAAFNAGEVGAKAS